MERVLIAGAGIGGLTLAAGLARRGIPALVVEQAERLAPVGAGLTVQPNAVLALRRLELSKPLEAAGVPLSLAGIYDRTGRALIRLSAAQVSALFAEVGAPALGLHRATIHEALAGQLGTSELRLGARVTAVDPQTATVTLADGTQVRGAVLVGADGVRSIVRTTLVGESPLRYSGYYCWRGVTSTRPFPAGWAGEFFGSGHRFGGCSIDGGRFYWFLCANGPAGGADTDTKAAVTQAAAEFTPAVRQAVQDTPVNAIRRDDITDRPPVTRWGSDRATLLGDAAHPSTPNLGQGACQAIEDALALTDFLSEYGTGPDALRRYERFRHSRASGIVKQSRTFGRVASWEGPVRIRARNTVARMVPGSALARQLRSAWTLPPAAG